MKTDDSDLDFAYRYPFSMEAREIIAGQSGGIEEKLVKIGKLRLEEDLNSIAVGYGNVALEDVKRVHVLSYVYSRMLVSALSNGLYLDKYVAAEASRAANAMEAEPLTGLMRLSTEMGVSLSYSQGQFVMKFADFLMLSSGSGELRLVKQGLGKGLVYFHKDIAIKVLCSAAAAEIRKKLPIAMPDLPQRIIDEAKTVKLPKIKSNIQVKEGSYRWIEKLLSTPIVDVRHRTVNLVLAPYFTNIKGLSENEAAEIIIEYIERCKQANPDTKVNSSYIKYQCKYAKDKGMKPLSLERARELYRGVLEFD